MRDDLQNTAILSNGRVSAEKILEAQPAIAAGVRNLILLGVSAAECNTYIMQKSGKKIGSQSLRDLMRRKEGGVRELVEFLGREADALPLEEQQEIFSKAREFAKKTAPTIMWRKDPGIDYCIQALLAEPHTSTFTVSTKTV